MLTDAESKLKKALQAAESQASLYSSQSNTFEDQLGQALRTLESERERWLALERALLDELQSLKLAHAKVRFVLSISAPM